MRAKELVTANYSAFNRRDSESHPAAEFRVGGTYKKTQAGMPPARWHSFTLAGCAFFESAEGNIKRVSNFYNLADWIAQVSR
jgi:steroid delta-isomerase-like uncharacterized protein